MYNQTLELYPGLCTLDTCPVEWGQIHYVPSLAGNAFYLVLFAVLLVIHLFLGVWYRLWAYAPIMSVGFILEVLGYVSRVQMSQNPFPRTPFIIYLTGLAIGPCFFAAAIYLSFSHIIPIWPEKSARFRPKTYIITFVCCDILSLVLQAIGGTLADIAEDINLSQAGINILIAGLGLQVGSLALFILLVAEFAWRIHSHREGAERQKGLVCPETKFLLFRSCLVIATICLFVRSSFRVAELSGGFNGKLANDQITFMILEGAMVSTACTALTIAHPGVIFGNSWGVLGAGGFSAKDRNIESVESGRHEK